MILDVDFMILNILKDFFIIFLEFLKKMRAPLQKFVEKNSKFIKIYHVSNKF